MKKLIGILAAVAAALAMTGVCVWRKGVKRA